MLVDLCNLSDYGDTFKRELVEAELNSERILDLMRQKKWYVDKLRHWTCKGDWKTDFGSIALRINRCWVGEDNDLKAEVEILDTPCGMILGCRGFPEGVSFALKAYSQDEVRNSQGEVVQEARLHLVGFSYILNPIHE